jgi:hypothetical protein
MKMKKFSKKLSTFLLGFVLATSGVTSVYASTITNEKFYLSDLFHTCDEVIAFEGNIHYKENATTDGNGGSHIKIQWNYVNVKGFGLTSGVRYVLKASDTIVSNVKAGQILSGSFTTHAIAQGAATDVLIHGVYHVTLDADGNVVTEVSHLKASCFES